MNEREKRTLIIDICGIKEPESKKDVILKVKEMFQSKLELQNVDIVLAKHIVKREYFCG